MIEVVLIVAALSLAYANGANDNFKGVATVYGSKVLSFEAARLHATVATLLGALAAAILAETLAKAFSGRGLVSNELVTSPLFATAVAMGAALTVLVATRVGMPVSTTHALVGSLAGVGVFVMPQSVNTTALLQQFLAPLAIGPLLAIACSFGLNALIRRYWHSRAKATDEACICAVPASSPIPVGYGRASAPTYAAALQLRLADASDPACKAAIRTGRGVTLASAGGVDRAHIVSAFLVCFARALNDAPKIAGLLLVAKTLGTVTATASVALAMTLGGWLHSRKIAETMAHKITPLEPRSAFVANICTALLVISASRFGLPLSTTHVSVGAITGTKRFGVSIPASAPTSALKSILIAWVATLPLAALLSVIAYGALRFAISL